MHAEHDSRCTPRSFWLRRRCAPLPQVSPRRRTSGASTSCRGASGSVTRSSNEGSSCCLASKPRSSRPTSRRTCRPTSRWTRHGTPTRSSWRRRSLTSRAHGPNACRPDCAPWPRSWRASRGPRTPPGQPASILPGRTWPSPCASSAMPLSLTWRWLRRWLPRYASSRAARAWPRRRSSAATRATRSTPHAASTQAGLVCRRGSAA